MSRAFAIVLLSLAFGMLIFGCAGQKAGAPALPAPPIGAVCSSYSAESCPSSCVVCPPCEACSSISCQTEQFCKGIGFDRSWYEGIKQNLAAVQAQQAASSTGANAGAGNLYVIHAPQYATLGGKNVLFYEVYLANRSAEGLYRVEALDGTRVLQAMEGDELNRSIRTPGAGVNDYALYMWVELKDGDMPAIVSHKLYFKEQPSALEGGNTAVNYAKPIVISPPLYGNGWLAAEAPVNTNHHRRGIITAMGKTGVSQRYATDWIQYGANDKMYKTDAATNEDFYCYGQEIRAVADGEIVDTKDGVPENVPWTPSPPFTVTWAGGNIVMQEIANGTYAFYAHMIPGSLRVKIGDKVKRGDVLGLLGNSGNSDAPHLHFHVATSKDALFGEGLPYAFESYAWEGNSDWVAQITKNTAWDGAFDTPKIMSMGMPAYDNIVAMGPAESGTLLFQSAFEQGTRYSTKSGKFAVLDLHGSFREMGRQYGYLMREEMQEAYNKTIEETTAMGMPKEQVKAAGDMLYDSNSEKYVELMQGMSETSGLTLEQQKELNGGVISLIEAYIYKAYADANITPPGAGCSAAVFWGNYSKDGKLYFGRNWDMVRSLLSPYLPYMTLAVYHPDSGNTVANLEWIGEVYTETAMNDKGLFLELNNGAQSDPTHPGGRAFAAVKLFDFMFDSSSMADISREFNTTLASDSYVIQVADKSNAYSFEWPTFGVRQRSENVSGLLVAYNSFVPPYPAEWQGKIAAVPTNDPRRDNMLKMANSEQYKGKMDEKLMQQFLAVGVKEGGGMLPDNVYQVIAVPEDYKMWLHGQNYSGWEEIDLKPLFFGK